VTRRGFHSATAVIVLILIAGLLVVDDYGITADEIHGIDVLSRNYELVVNDVPIDGVYKYDGTVFNFAAEGIYQLYKHLIAGPARKAELDRDMVSAFHARIQVKHIVTFLSSLLAYACVAVMVGLLCGWRYAWVGPLVLVLVPRFFGHGFFNFKDIPFAALFTLCSLQGTRIVHRAVFNDSGGRLDGRLVRGLVLYGLLVAGLTGIRFGGFIHLAFPVAAWLAMALAARRPGATSVPRLAGGYLLALGSWFAGTVALYPYLWGNPVGGIVDMLTAMSDYPWPGRVLFDGEFIRAYNLPAIYLPVWLAITTPVLTLAAAAAGFVWMLWRWPAMAPLSRVLVVFIFLQAFFLPLTSILGGATYYDGLRHFMFVLPVAAVAASVLLVRAYSSIARRAARIAFVAVVGAGYLPVLADMHALHPYEPVYFNRAFGGLAAADGRFETDYWGLSLREGAEWLSRNAGEDAVVVAGGPVHSIQPFLDRRMRLVPLQDVKGGQAGDLGDSWYYIARPRWELQDQFNHCGEVFAVIRQETSLTIVRHCRDE
jgi:hypothetical protein